MTSGPDSIDLLGTTSGRLVAVRLKPTHKRIFRALLSLSSAALLARVAGMVNQVVASAHFGAGATMDAYFVVYTLPTVLAYLFIGSIEAAFIPVYARVREEGNKEQASRVFSTVLNLVLLSTIVLTVLLIIFRRLTISLTAPALDPFRAGMAADLAPFMYPVLVLMVVVGLLECVFNVENQFGWPAYAGLLVPLTTAAFVVIAGQSQGVVVLCTGMVFGLCLQLGFFLIRAKRAELVYRPVLDLRIPEIGAIFIALWPALLAGLVGQASPVVDQIFASLLSAGSISALGYALKIVSVFSGVIFASLGRAVLPYLSRQAANKDMKAFKNTLRLYLWVIGLSTVALSLFVLLLAHPIVQILFQRGAFSAEDTDRTATTFIGFVFGLTPMALGFICARAFSALGKTSVLMWTSVFSVIANAVFDYIFAPLWQSQGIALSTSAVYFCSMLILLIMLRRSIGNLRLLKPPVELFTLIDRIKRPLDKLYASWGKKVTQVSIALALFIVGIVANRLNSIYALRIALGSIFMVFLLRYPYILVIAWVLVSVIVSPIFTNSNILTGLTVPTLLLMTYLPVGVLFKRMPMLVFFLLYLIWVFASIGISTIGVGPFLTVWLTDLDYLMLALLVIHTLTTQRHLYRLIDSIIFGGVCVSLFGIYGYITRQNGVIDPTTYLFRIFSIFTAAPTLALFLSIIIPLALYRVRVLRGWKQAGALLAVLLLLVTVLLTFARLAFISIFLSFLISVLFLPKSKARNVLLGSMAGLAVSMLLMLWVVHIPLLSRFLNQDAVTLNGRTLLWQALLAHFDPRQLLGNGLDASNQLLANLQVSLNGRVIAVAPSNLFLGTLYDHGIIGLGLLLVMMVALFIGIIRGLLRKKGEQRVLFSVALAILVSVFLQSFEQDDFWTQAIGLYFWIIIALPFARCWDGVEKALDEDDDIGNRITNMQIEVPWSIQRRDAVPDLNRSF